MIDKAALRKKMRTLRQDHVANLPSQTRALLFMRPPAFLANALKPNAIIGLYYAGSGEAPTLGYAKWLHEQGYKIALPRFESKDAPMHFSIWENPYDEKDLEKDPHGSRQPKINAEHVTPNLLFTPLLAFTERCERLGQGGGHYDRFLEAHPDVPAYGLAWDIQHLDQLPLEAHDQKLRGIITPTRFYQAD